MYVLYSAEWGENIKSFSDVWLLYAIRLPIALPFIWSAIFASKRYSLAAQLEEDYAHKTSLSTVFEGYKNAFINMDQDLSDANAEDNAHTLNRLDLLIGNVMHAISENANRIYKKNIGNDLKNKSILNLLKKKKTDTNESDEMGQ